MTFRLMFGALAALAFSALLPVASQAQPSNSLPTVNFCTAKGGGNYEFVGLNVAEQAKGALNVVVVNDAGKRQPGNKFDPSVRTNGSLDNLANLDNGGCDIAVVQSDALSVYLKDNPGSKLNIERGRALYQEYINFICNKSAGISKITGLTPNHTVLVGANGGGSSLTFRSFQIADPNRYGKVPTKPVGGLRAAQQVQEGTDAACMFYVTGLNDSSLKEIDGIAKQEKGRFYFVPANDSDMPKLKDPRGKPMYSNATIPGATYPNLQVGTFGTSVDTIAVDAVIVTRVDWIDANERANTALLRAITAAMPAILKRVGG